MRKISKKTIKRIRRGYFDGLMESIEFLIDTYNEDKYDFGYKSCLDDMTVHSYNLAMRILADGEKIIPTASVDHLSKLIDDYYTNAIKEDK
jgi:hypothetical protein